MIATKRQNSAVIMNVQSVHFQLDHKFLVALETPLQLSQIISRVHLSPTIVFGFG